MMRSQTLLALLIAWLTTIAANAQTDDERAIRALIESHSVALNKRNLAEASAVYSDDATIVTAAGQTYTGREGVDRWHTEAVNGPRPFVHFHPADMIRVYLLDAATAVADVVTEIPRPPGADGQPTPSVRAPLFIALVKREGRWQVAAQRPAAVLPTP
jgi:uncharacterized protein (TIGR02246 family)